MIQRIFFVSRHTAENTPGWPDWAAISISDPYAALGDARLMAGWHAIHQCAFHDVDPSNSSSYMHEFMECITDVQAEAMVAFVREVAPV